MNHREPPPDAPLIIVSSRVLALDRTTGKQRWRYEIEGDGTVSRRFAFDGDRLFVFDNRGAVHCLELATGRLIGRVETELKTANNMLVDGDRIYLADDHHAVAMTFDGRILWREAIPSNGSHSLCGLGVPGGNVVQPDFSNA